MRDKGLGRDWCRKVRQRLGGALGAPLRDARHRKAFEGCQQGPKVHIQVFQTPAKCQSSRNRGCSGRA